MKMRVYSFVIIINLLSCAETLMAETGTGTYIGFTVDNRYALNTSSGSGGIVSTPGEGSYLYTSGTSVSVVAESQSHYHFVNWTGSAVTAGKVTNVISAGTSVTMSSDYTLIANFARNQYSLTTSSTSGGSVISPAEGTSSYDYGTTVNLAATPSEGYCFDYWIGPVSNSTSANTSVTVSGNTSVQAVFALEQIQYVLTVASDGHGSVTGSGTYVSGSSVSITATPYSNYQFDNWQSTGDLFVTNSSAASTTVDVSGSGTVVAHFEQIHAFEAETLSVLNDDITSKFTVLRGEITNDGGIPDCWYKFRYYKKSEGYEQEIETAQKTMTTINGKGEFTQLVEGLDPNCTYVYQAIAGNSMSYSIGRSLEFATDEKGGYWFVDMNASEYSIQNGSMSNPFRDVQFAVDEAVDGDRIIVSPGTYSGPLSFKGKSIQVMSLAAVDANVLCWLGETSLGAIDRTIIHGQYEGAAVIFDSGEDANAVLTGFTITGGLNQAGGGILCYGSSPTINRCVISGNRAMQLGGAALDLVESRARLINCTIANNYSHNSNGAAVVCEDSNDIFVNCIIWDNYPDQIMVTSGHDPNVSYCNIQNDVWPGIGNMSKNPLFAMDGQWVDSQDPNNPVDPSFSEAYWMMGDYHLLSYWGRYCRIEDNWTSDDDTSPCLDLGDPDIAFGLESNPNGARINMGVYGGTGEASRSGF